MPEVCANSPGHFLGLGQPWPCGAADRLHTNRGCALAVVLCRVNGTTEHLDMPAAAQLLLETVSEPVRERIRRQGAVFAGALGRDTGDIQQQARASPSVGDRL